ncbi:divergent polysaccharide deacetylase family protein [Kiloniella sp.]|uniref:divergent polysaccharide deacetylase family protein n=1 Tax=Kiloniella sp. TaxID=1938587 RepID=UPI003A8D93C0
MNWKKILLITCWAVLVSIIGAAVGYTILGPHVPLPYQYEQETSPQDGDENHSEDVSSLGNEDIAAEDISGQDSPLSEDPTQPELPIEEKETPNASNYSPSTQDEATASLPEDGTDTEHLNNEAEDSQETTEITAPTPEENAAEETKEEENKTADHASDATIAQKDETVETTSAAEGVSTVSPEVAAINPSPYPPNPPVFSNEPSWKLFGQKVPEANGRPRIAIVLTGLGLSKAATDAAIRQLPSQITLSFTPYAKNLESWIALARSQNHEVMLDLPMEPLTYPSDDPGPQALLTGRQPEGNLNNLAWIATRGSGYVGMAAYMGSRFVTSERQMRPVMEYFKDHGLLFLDSGDNDASLVSSLGKSLGTPVVVNQRAIDEAQLSRQAIDARLAQIERIATKNNFAIATGRPFPVTLERIAKWVNDIEQRGFQLVPITAVIDESSLTTPTQEPSSPTTIN